MTASVAGVHRVRTPFVLSKLQNECCDRCGAAAKLCVLMANGSDLVFCGHHANKNVSGILELAVRLVFHEDFNRSSFEQWIEPA